MLHTAALVVIGINNTANGCSIDKRSGHAPFPIRPAVFHKLEVGEVCFLQAYPHFEEHVAVRSFTTMERTVRQPDPCMPAGSVYVDPLTNRSLGCLPRLPAQSCGKES